MKRRPFQRCKGVTAVLAMLFLMLFGTMAVGFYASTTMSVQVSGNERRATEAYLAAESGMDFVRYQLARVSIPPGTTQANVMTELYNDLAAHLNGTSNLSGHTISRTGNTIQIPASGTIKLNADGTTGFRATITEWAGEIVVKSQGVIAQPEIGRAITMDFTRQQKSTSIFDFAVASKGQIVMKKGAITTVTGVDPLLAAVMSALPSSSAIKMSGGVIGGELTVLDTADADITGGTVAGYSTTGMIRTNALNQVPDPPEFPTFDPTVYKTYATNTWVSGKKTQSNIILPKNSGTTQHPVKFNANDVVQGILYIESPNVVQFNGNFNLKGFIVMESSTSTTDALNFTGNVTMSPLPNQPAFDALRATSGIAILAPNAAIAMTGSADSQLRGSVVCNTFSFAGSADLQIDQGTLLTYKEATNTALFNGKTVRFSSTGSSNLPTTGVTYSTYYAPNASSYQEVTE